MSSSVLVMAKAPVPGLAKTRLGASVGADVAAELAAASILDTLDVCESVFDDPSRRHVAMTGDIAAAARALELADRLSRWTVHPQRGEGFAARLAHAHEDVGRATGNAVVQIGMDTPHLTAAALTDVSTRLGDGCDAVLGAADDGGWWVLGVTDHRLACVLRDVEMSTDHTYADTLSALQRSGARVAPAATMRDVDTVDDASHVAALAPDTRFARLWSIALTGVSPPHEP
jgi:hypothetical protein